MFRVLHFGRNFGACGGRCPPRWRGAWCRFGASAAGRPWPLLPLSSGRRNAYCFPSPPGGRMPIASPLLRPHMPHCFPSPPHLDAHCFPSPPPSHAPLLPLSSCLRIQAAAPLSPVIRAEWWPNTKFLTRLNQSLDDLKGCFGLLRVHWCCRLAIRLGGG